MELCKRNQEYLIKQLDKVEFEIIPHLLNVSVNLPGLGEDYEKAVNDTILKFKNHKVDHLSVHE